MPMNAAAQPHVQAAFVCMLHVCACSVCERAGCAHRPPALALWSKCFTPVLFLVNLHTCTNKNQSQRFSRVPTVKSLNSLAISHILPFTLLDHFSSFHKLIKTNN